MHGTSLKDVIGKRPVALVFATPALCESRVCGPVVDIAQQLKSKYGDRMTFIHQEVYVDNQHDKGLREPLAGRERTPSPRAACRSGSGGKDGRVRARERPVRRGGP